MTASPEMAAPALPPVRLLPRIAVLLNLFLSEQVGRRLDTGQLSFIAALSVTGRFSSARSCLPFIPKPETTARLRNSTEPHQSPASTHPAMGQIFDRSPVSRLT
jgi:hypothetical protein